MNIINIDFPEREYIQEKTEKSLIVLHHTVSSSARSSINFWKQDEGGLRVACPYIIEKDGNIYQLYEDDYWSYHLGKGYTSFDNQKSIGIEIVNEGPLSISEGYYFWFDGKVKYSGLVYKSAWRNEYYWATYNDLQIKAAAELVKDICRRHPIPRRVITNYKYKPEYKFHTGIAAHHNLRADKTDVSPAFNLKYFEDLIK